METNNEIQAYREAILKAMLDRKDPEEGYPLILEKDARELLAHTRGSGRHPHGNLTHR